MTITDLYREITGDKTTHHRTITAAIESQSKARRATVALYAAGMSDRKVAEATHKAHGAARTMLLRTMRSAHKRIHHLPRYHQRGRQKGQFAGYKPATKAAEPSEQPQGFRAFLTPEERARL
jgi:HPt (histidine-containing phosphotransfer) domain-containing protein